jgi:hypothetical protein
MKQPFQISTVQSGKNGVYAVMVRPVHMPAATKKITAQQAREMADCLRSAADAVDQKYEAEK